MARIHPWLLAALLSLTLAPAFAQDSPRRAITHIAGDLYRFQNNFHYSVFLVTDEGILVTDPINADAARWLKRQLAERFPDRPIRYLVYSHDHADHIAGGEVFADQAIVVAHRQARADIIGEQRPTAVPDLTFSEAMTIELGGRTVELRYVGQGHSDNMIIMHFPPERAVFAVDFIAIDRLPYRDLTDAYFPEWIAGIEMVEAMDYDILVPGHGPLGTPEDVAEHRRYLQALYDAVLAAARDGQSLEEMKRSILLEDFSHLGQYDAWRELNIEGMYRQVSLHRRGN